MNDKYPYPDFISPFMKMWLAQYAFNKMGDITVLGFFDWRFSPNRRNPQKPSRRVSYKANVQLKVSPVKMECYFLQIDASTLHVHEVTGFSLAGSSVAYEYTFKEGLFVKGDALFSMIS
jgi:hypothetical protein